MCTMLLLACSEVNAKRYKVNFVYGLISEKKSPINSMPFQHIKQSRDEGLRKFIRNCPANSSSILVSKKRYIISGGCNENFISPDQVLFLRLFTTGTGVFLNQVVATLPSGQSNDRLSSQIHRRRHLVGSRQPYPCGNQRWLNTQSEE